MSEFKTKYGPWAIVTGANAGIGRSIATSKPLSCPASDL